MMCNAQKTHIFATLMLLVAALLPVQPLATTGAYGDTETSSGNLMQAWGGDEPLANTLELSAFSLTSLGEPVLEGEVAGTSTASTTPTSDESGQADKASNGQKVEVSGELLKVTASASSTDVEVSDEPLEVVEPEEKEEEEETGDKESPPEKVEEDPAVEEETGTELESEPPQEDPAPEPVQEE